MGVIRIQNKEYSKRIEIFFNKTDLEVLRNNHAIIAGGSIISIINNQKINDIDIYFYNKKDFEDKVKHFVRMKYISLFVSNNAVTVGNKQFIYCKFCDDIESLLNTFDIYACMGAYDIVTDTFYFHSNFFFDNMNKRIVLNNSTSLPSTILFRVVKYINKGYKIDKKEIFKLLIVILGSGVQNIEDLKNETKNFYCEELLENFIEDTSNVSFTERDKIQDLLKRVSEYSFIKQTAVDIQENNTKNYLKLLKVLGDKWIFFLDCNHQYRYFILLSDKTITLDYIYINCHHNELHKEFDFIDYTEYVKNKFPLTTFKIVRLDSDGTLHSFYNDEFTYKLGEVSVGDTLHSCIKLQNLQYTNRDDAVLIKTQIESTSDINWRYGDLSGDTISSKKLLTTKVYTKEETDLILDGIFGRNKGDAEGSIF